MSSQQDLSLKEEKIITAIFGPISKYTSRDGLIARPGRVGMTSSPRKRSCVKSSSVGKAWPRSLHSVDEKLSIEGSIVKIGEETAE